MNRKQAAQVARYLKDHSASPETVFAVDTESLELILQAKTAPEEEAPSGELKIDYAAEVSRELTEALGRKVTLKEGRTGGKIELQYYGGDDREALIKLLYNLKR